MAADLRPLSEAREIYGGGGGGLIVCQDGGTLTAAVRPRMVYIDPPFLTGGVFQYTRGEHPQTAYTDRFESSGAYDDMMAGLIQRAHDLLTEDGSFFLHIDYRAYARLRLIADDIFGEKNFLNEIIWAYDSGGRALKHFSRKHDIILFYQKDKNHFFDLKAVPIGHKSDKPNHMKRTLDEGGRPCRQIRSGGKIYTYYEDAPVFPTDVWTDIGHLQQKDPERTGYETQKPERLLARMILSATEPGDTVADLCMGSGTTAAAAAGLGRRFLCADIGLTAMMLARKRLAAYEPTIIMPPSLNGVTADCDIELVNGAVRFTCRSAALFGWAAGYVREDGFHAGAFMERGAECLSVPREEGAPAVLLVGPNGEKEIRGRI